VEDLEKVARALCGQSGDAPKCWRAYEKKSATILADVKRLKEKIEAQNPTIGTDTDDYIDLCVRVIEEDHPAADNYLRADDYRVSGEVWRVHKGDVDPWIFQHIVVPESQRPIANAGQASIAFGVSLVFDVLSAIDLNDQPCLVAYEIGNVASDWNLPPEFERIQLS
jgi:hypothetical protein